MPKRYESPGPGEGDEITVPNQNERQKGMVFPSSTQPVFSKVSY
jgi:hypothetical protein